MKNGSCFFEQLGIVCDVNCLRSDINQLLKLCVTPLMVVLIFFSKRSFFCYIVAWSGQAWIGLECQG